MKQATKDIKIGFKLPTEPFNITRENITTFHCLVSGVKTRDDFQEESIHLDPEFARSVGLPDVIADGAQTSTEISRLLTDYFGDGFLSGGHLFTKFIKPVYPNYCLNFDIEVKGRTEEDTGIRYEMGISCSNQDKVLVLVGNASAWVR